MAESVNETPVPPCPQNTVVKVIKFPLEMTKSLLYWLVIKTCYEVIQTQVEYETFTKNALVITINTASFPNKAVEDAFGEKTETVRIGDSKFQNVCVEYQVELFSRDLMARVLCEDPEKLNKSSVELNLVEYYKSMKDDILGVNDRQRKSRYGSILTFNSHHISCDIDRSLVVVIII